MFSLASAFGMFKIRNSLMLGIHVRNGPVTGKGKALAQIYVIWHAGVKKD